MNKCVSQYVQLTVIGYGRVDVHHPSKYYCGTEEGTQIQYGHYKTCDCSSWAAGVSGASSSHLHCKASTPSELNNINTVITWQFFPKQ